MEGGGPIGPIGEPIIFGPIDGGALAPYGPRLCFDRVLAAEVIGLLMANPLVAGFN